MEVLREHLRLMLKDGGCVRAEPALAEIKNKYRHAEIPFEPAPELVRRS